MRRTVSCLRLPVNVDDLLDLPGSCVDARNEYRAWTNHPYLPYVLAVVCLVRHILPVQRHFVLLQTLPPDLLIAH